MEKIRAELMKRGLYDVIDAATSEANDGKYGTIYGVKVGDRWPTRKKCAEAGVHIATFAGIAGSAETGAYSVALSGGYEDDEDNGEVFTYTGTGGRGEGGSFEGHTEQRQDQSFSHHDNAALMVSRTSGRPVRVVRRPNPQSKYAPKSGFRYDGLYVVEDAYLDKGKSGYLVCKFKFRRVKAQDPLPKE